MDRRNFIKAIGAGSLFATMPASFRLYGAPAEFNGKLVITVQAEGGWDVTSFCDPKTNVPGEWEINHWAREAEPGQAGNISYAPFAQNEAFFQKYYNDMLVINGIDAQTNSHTAGVTHNWSGRISEGFPSLTALYASVLAPDLPISYVNNGGFNATGNLIRYTRLDDTWQLLNVIYPNRPAGGGPEERWLNEADWQRVAQVREAELTALNAAENISSKQARNRANYQSALNNAASLKDFATVLRNAGDIQEPVESGNFWSSFRRQAQLALLAMSAGVTASADLIHWGFDTHQNHDADHTWLLGELTGGLDYLWTYAEELGLADRLVVIVASDFSRTPHYNDDNGKDHWPIGSMVVMERGVNWGNRMVGVTDEGHNAIPLNPSTLAEDSSNGTIIYPKHVMQSLREYLGISDHVNASGFAFNNLESFDFFQMNQS